MISSIEFQNAVKQPTPTNHVVIIDVSYSMCQVLPELRNHLKSNLAMLVKPKDTVSVIYFSSKGKFGSVFVGQPIRDLDDLSTVNSAIDRFITPQGCTGFVEPLELALTIPGQIDNTNNNSLVFMTDGYDNEWPEYKILDVAGRLSSQYQNTTIIEYGWNCNRPLLEKMAAKSGALHLFAESYTDYEQTFEDSITSQVSKRVSVDVGAGSTHVLFVDGDKVHVTTVEDQKASIPEHVKKIWVTSPSVVKEVGTIKDQAALYAVLYYGVHMMDKDLIWASLAATGDVRLINQFNNCFTKQDYSTFKLEAEYAVVFPAGRLTQGQDYNLVPDPNAPTVLDVLNLLVDNDIMLVTSHDAFSYNRTGRATSTKEDDTIDKLSEQIASADSKEERKALAKQLVSYEDWTPEFTKIKDPLGLVSMNTLVSNASRPNVSIQTTTHGTVSIPEFVQERYSKLTATIKSMIYRNYTIVKDGIINMKKLPVILPLGVKEELASWGVKFDSVPMDIVTPEGQNAEVDVTVIDLTYTPLISRAMTMDISAKDFFTDAVELQRLKALQKVLKFYREQIVGKVNATGLADLYGAEAAAYLSEKGIRDYGFSPKVDVAESTDFYMSREMNVKVKGLSSLPAVDAVRKKIADGKKLTVSDGLMVQALARYDEFVNSELITKSAAKNILIEEWIKTETTHTIGLVRELNKRQGRVVYAVVAGHAWFKDLSFEDPTMILKVGGVDYTITVALEEKEVKI